MTSTRLTCTRHDKRMHVCAKGHDKIEVKTNERQITLEGEELILKVGESWDRVNIWMDAWMAKAKVVHRSMVEIPVVGFGRCLPLDRRWEFPAVFFLSQNITASCHQHTHSGY